MQPLEKTFRNKLERTVKDAREAAEEAARAAAEQLGVGEPSAPKHLRPVEVDLRRRLRIHGYQLGDLRDSKSTNPAIGRQEIDCLVEEVAYEHWHRMLFARFLTENNLLMYPDPDDPVPVTLEECEDLAAEEGAKNGWELAARFAKDMLPQIFRADSPVFGLILPPEHQQRLERLLADLPPEVFQASDSLGWVYQFWQAKRKDEVNASEVKIGARELPAVTQLFTEPYMVEFLLHNTLGAWWAGKRLTAEDAENAETEQELRNKLALPGVEWTYLRFVRGADGKGGPWRPAAGTFQGWPKAAAGLKVLDPCCGSGHFIVAAFSMLVPMRMEMEGLSEQDAVDAVLRDNLHGLEIDKRCVELGVFNLALAAWRRTGYRPLPPPHVACTGIAPQASKEQWLDLAEQSGMPGSSLERGLIERALVQLHDLFSQAPTLGSLIDPNNFAAGEIAADYETIQPYLTAIRAVEKADDETRERAIAAAGMVKAADLLAGDYALIVTNVPYLARGKQCESLKDFIALHHDDARQDLATAFFDRSLKFAQRGGTLGIVCPQNWLSLPAYSALRKRLLKTRRFEVMAKLGPGAFGTISGEVVNVALVGITAVTPPSEHRYGGVDASSVGGIPRKGEALAGGEWRTVVQRDALDSPDARITLEARGRVPTLGEYANSPQGIKTGDDGRFRRNWWEPPCFDRRWRPFQGTPEADGFAGGMRYALDWSDDGREFARLQGTAAWGKRGVVVKLMGDFSFSLYHGELFDSNVTAIVPGKDDLVEPVWAFCLSPTFREELSVLEDGIKVNNATVVKVPFNLAHWQEVAAKKYPDGLPEPESDDPTQWLFHGHPYEANEDAMLQVAVGRLLGYRWPAELDDKMRLSKRARALVKKCGELAKFADGDGIVCIPPVGGEPSAADRLHNLLAKAFGVGWNKDKLNELLKRADHGGKTLETWLRDKFFIQHCQLFHHRPFIWHIWDGLRDGFSVLVNYHKLDHKNLETLIFTYLGDWIKRQKDDSASGMDGAQERLAAAERLKRQLELILKGEAPYDIFVRWKPIEQQPIGWDPDLNDGVRLNIRPFMSATDMGKRGAGILRDKPNVNWNKDRGKDVESAPWYPLFKGDRINDYHVTLEEKLAARAAKKESGKHARD